MKVYYGRCANVKWAPAFLDSSWRLHITYWRRWIAGLEVTRSASVITWSDKECIDIFRTNVPMNDYHTFKYRKIAPSLPEIFSKIIFRFTCPKFSLATSQSVKWRGGGWGGGRLGNSHISYESDVMGACRLAWRSNDFLPKISLKDVGRGIAT